MRLPWLGPSLIACAPPSAPPRPSPVPPAPTPAVASGASIDVDAAPAPAPPTGHAPAASFDAVQVATATCAVDDRAFCTAALRLADRDGNHIAGWGTVRLDGSRRRYRFATIVPLDLGWGTYLIERTPGSAWLITYNHDGRTAPFMSWAGADQIPTWEDREDTAIAHSQTFHRGGEWLDFGVRGGTLVVLDYKYTDLELTEDNVVRTFARGLSHTPDGAITGGRCVTPCPALAGFPVPEARLGVEGPRPLHELVGD